MEETFNYDLIYSLKQQGVYLDQLYYNIFYSINFLMIVGFFI